MNRQLARVPLRILDAATWILAATAFAIVAVHLATYGPRQWGPTLSTAAFVLFPTIFLAFAPPIAAMAILRLPWTRLLGDLSPALKIVGLAAAAYVAIDFFLMTGLLTGQPMHTASGFVLNDHGSFTSIDEATFDQDLMYQARLFTGHEMFFAGFAALIVYQLDRVRRGTIDLDRAPRDDGLERNPFPRPLSRSLVLQTMLSPADCSARLLAPARVRTFAFTGGYGIRGTANEREFRLELGGPSGSMVYAAGRFEGSQPTFVRVLITLKRWYVIGFVAFLAGFPVLALVVSSIGFGFFPWQPMAFVYAAGGALNIVYAFAQMRSLLRQIEQATLETEVSIG